MIAAPTPIATTPSSAAAASVRRSICTDCLLRCQAKAAVVSN